MAACAGLTWLKRLALAGAATALVAGCGGAAAKRATGTTTSSTATTTSTTRPGPTTATGTAVTAPATTVVSVPPAESYSWQKDTGLSLDLGGGSSSTLSAVLAPGPQTNWLVAGTQFSSAGSTVATVWTSPTAQRWAETALPMPAGVTSSQALAAMDWGTRRVVVGSVGSGPAMTAAVWVSPGPANAFSLVPSVSSSPSGTTTTTSTTTTSTTTTTTTAGTTTTATPTGGTRPGAASGSTTTSGQATTTVGPTTTTTAPSAVPAGSVMDEVAAGTLGLFAAGTSAGKAVMWYSSNGQNWSLLAGADKTLDGYPGAVVDSLLSAANGVFAAGYWHQGDRLSAGLWYSGDGIHWRGVGVAPGSFAGPGDHEITSLISISEPGGGTGGPSGLLAVGGTRVGPTWQPASWISPDGFSWSETSDSFSLNDEPSGSPGALVYAATSNGEGLFAVGGSPHRQRLWTSQQGLAWSGASLPANATADSWWHLGLVAADGNTLVVADNLPGQPYVLVRQGSTWSEPSAAGAFGNPLPTAVPTSLITDNGALVMSVNRYNPGATLGTGSTSVAVLTSADGRAWRTANGAAFHQASAGQLLGAPDGVVAVGTASVEPATGGGRPSTGAFASLSTDRGVDWRDELISPTGLGAPGSSGTVGPTSAVAAGRLGASQYVVGQAGAQAVRWFSADGTIWQGPVPLDPTPQVADEQVITTCSMGSGAVVAGTETTPAYGSQAVAWTSTDGSTWAPATFTPSPVAGSFAAIYGCLSTGNGYLAYGETAQPGQGARPTLWSSSDGTAWQQLTTTFTGVGGGNAAGPQAAPLDGVAVGTITWLGLSGDGDLPSQLWPAPVGGAPGLAITTPGLWVSTDAGSSWQQLDTSSTAFAAAAYSQADVAAYVGRSPVVAGTVDGQLTVWVGKPPS